MKLGVAYNIFDSLELLPFSIKSIYDNVDVIVLVYSNKSNDLQIESHKDIGIYLNKIKASIDTQNKITITRDDPIHRPGSLIRSFNELHKRNFGLDILKQKQCTHCMLMDCDELYVSTEFNKIKQYIIENDITNTTVDLYNYYKFPEVQYKDLGNTHVSFITKLDMDTELQWNNRPEIRNIDPTRKLFYKNDNIEHIEITKIAMHHFSWLRRNVRMKIITSSACVNWTTEDNFVTEYLQKYDAFKIGDSFFLPGPNGRFGEMKPDQYQIVSNQFNIEI